LSFMSVFARKFKTLLILYTTYHMNILYFSVPPPHVINWQCDEQNKSPSLVYSFI
jgi:hypothetical protein